MSVGGWAGVGGGELYVVLVQKWKKMESKQNERSVEVEIWSRTWTGEARKEVLQCM